MAPRPVASLIGRESNLAALREALESASAGRGRLAAISGEAGIGKTALVDALATEAARRGIQVVVGRAWELAEAPPYFPVWPCLRSLGFEDRSDTPFELWERVLAALATAGPAVWIVEDVHVADLQTVDLLAFLARQISALRLLIAVTLRRDDPRVTEAMQQRLTRIVRAGVEIPLEPLRRDEVAVLASQCAGRALTVAEVSRLLERTGGNPLFVTECARTISGTTGELPRTVRHAILERVALLPRGCQELLTIAAVIGREVNAALVARVRDEPPARVIGLLEPAVRAGLIDEVGQGRLAFRHVLVREALEGAAGAEVAAALHGKIERALAEDGESLQLLIERARHALMSLHGVGRGGLGTGPDATPGDGDRRRPARGDDLSRRHVRAVGEQRRLG